MNLDRVGGWPVVLALLMLLAVGLGSLLLRWRAAYPQAARRMAEELLVGDAGGSSTRVTPRSRAPAMQHLAEAVNRLADAHDRLRAQMQLRTDEAQARVSEEKGRLAALMSELSHGVLVCDADGRILLHNERAARLLEQGATAGAPAVAFGQSIYALLDKGPLVHALDRIERGLEQRQPHPVADFVVARGERQLRLQMAPVPDAQGEAGGFVLMLDDVSRALQAEGRRERLLQQLTESLRASLANIRAAVETVEQYPDMEPARRQRFLEVIRHEAQHLSARLDATAEAEREEPGAPWPLEDLRAADLVYALQREIERRLGIAVAHQDDGAPLWLSVDSHALVQALTGLMERLADRFGMRSIVVETRAAERFVRLSLCWHGLPLEPQLLAQWRAEDDGAGGRLDDLLARHGAEMWSQTDPIIASSRVCVQLPAARLPARA